MMRKLVGLFTLFFCVQSCIQEPDVRPECPTIRKVNPISVGPGESYSIIGENFNLTPKCYKVSFSGDVVLDDLTALNDSTIRLTVPDNIENGPFKLEYSARSKCGGLKNIDTLFYKYNVVPVPVEKQTIEGSEYNEKININGIAIEPKGDNQADVYVIDVNEGNRILRIVEDDILNTNGFLEYYAGCMLGAQCYSSTSNPGDATVALNQSRFQILVDLSFVEGFNGNNSLFLVDSGNSQVRRINVDTKRVSNFAGVNRNTSFPRIVTNTCEPDLLGRISDVSASKKSKNIYITEFINDSSGGKSLVFEIGPTSTGPCINPADIERTEAMRSVEVFIETNGRIVDTRFSEYDDCLYFFLAESNQLLKKCNHSTTVVLNQVKDIEGTEYILTDFVIDPHRNHIFFIDATTHIVGFVDLNLMDGKVEKLYEVEEITPTDKLDLFVVRSSLHRILYFTETKKDRIQKLILI